MNLPSWVPDLYAHSNANVEQFGGQVHFGVYNWDGVFNNIGASPKVSGHEIHTAGLLGPKVIAVYDAFPLESWKDGSWRDFAVGIILRGQVSARGSHPLNAIFRTLMSTEIKKFNEVFLRRQALVLSFGSILIGKWSKEWTVAEMIEVIESLQLPRSGSFIKSILKAFDLPVNSAAIQDVEGLMGTDRLMDLYPLVVRSFEWAQIYFRFSEIGLGYFGLLPRYSVPGDIVAFIKGFGPPVVLRPNPSHPDYILVGTCWVHGLMEGEVAEIIQSGSPEWIFRRIRIH